MKEKYEKPKIESESFALEVMHARCTATPGNVMYAASYYAAPPMNCTCKYTSSTSS